MKSAPDIDFDYSPSRRVPLALGVMTLAAVACILASGLPLAARAALAVLALAGWVTWRPVRGPLQVSWDGDGHWSVLQPGASPEAVQLAGHAQFAGVVLLRLIGNRGPSRTLLLTCADIREDTWRHLRIRLAGHRPP